MSAFNVTAVVLIAVIAVMGIIVYAVLAASWRVLHDDGRLRLAEMLRRHGVAPEEACDVAGYQGAIAVRRCMMCAQKSACDQWRPTSAKHGMETFCPNARFVAHMSRR